MIHIDQFNKLNICADSAKAPCLVTWLKFYSFFFFQGKFLSEHSLLTRGKLNNRHVSGEDSVNKFLCKLRVIFMIFRSRNFSKTKLMQKFGTSI